MSETVDINMSQVAEVICDQIISRYAATGKLVAEDYPNKWGVSVSFGNKDNNKDKARFVFVTKDDLLVELFVSIRAFIIHPKETRDHINTVIAGTIEKKKKHDQEQSHVIITSSQPAGEGVIIH